jgi:hypothetical protein
MCRLKEPMLNGRKGILAIVYAWIIWNWISGWLPDTSGSGFHYDTEQHDFWQQPYVNFPDLVILTEISAGIPRMHENNFTTISVPSLRWKAISVAWSTHTDSRLHVTAQSSVCGAVDWNHVPEIILAYFHLSSKFQSPLHNIQRSGARTHTHIQFF